jgi:F0F1-type ATP synthase membrane subunit b/b'
MWYFLGFLVLAFVLYKFRVPILAKILGQSEGRITRQIRRKGD